MKRLVYLTIGITLFLSVAYSSSVIIYGLPINYYTAALLCGIYILSYVAYIFLSRTHIQSVLPSKTIRLIAFAMCGFATFAQVSRLQAQQVVTYAVITGTSSAGVGYVTSYTDVDGINAEIGRWDTPYPNGNNGAYVPDLQPKGKSNFYVDIDVNDGGIANFSYKLQTYDAGIYDWYDIYVETPNEKTSVLNKLGKPGVDYGNLFESAYIPLSIDLNSWQHQHIRLVFSVEQDGWGDQTQGLITSLAIRPCKIGPIKIGPLTALQDPDAVKFESGDRVNTTKLVDDMKTALSCLQTAVTEANGTLTVNSAYRPPEYQAHLREIWDKWDMLKNSKEPECADLKAKVKAEFQQHGLLSSQRPAAKSKHTEGKAIDISSSLATKDLVKLADECNLYRPIPKADPVHYIHK